MFKKLLPLELVTLDFDVCWRLDENLCGVVGWNCGGFFGNYSSETFCTSLTLKEWQSSGLTSHSFSFNCDLGPNRLFLDSGMLLLLGVSASEAND